MEHILNRRKYYKERKKETKDLEYEIVDAKQNSLKWMLVTSFGYLGYRNAKFGRIESHEAVTAFGREKLLTAKDSAEERGYTLSHGMTDCIFIHKKDFSKFEHRELAVGTLSISNSSLQHSQSTVSGDKLCNTIIEGYICE